MDKDEEGEQVLLYQFGPHPDDLTIPSISPQSLALQAYLRVLGVPCEVVNVYDSAISPTGKLPLLVVGHVEVAAGLDECVAWLAEHGCDAQPPTEAERADTHSYSALLQHRLYPCQLFNWFAEERNYEEWTRPAFTVNQRWPLSAYSAWSLRRTMLHGLAERGYVPELADTVYADARGVYETLSRKLGDNMYFFGDMPTRLDCYVYGYLRSQDTALPVPRLRALLRAHENLVDFVNRMQHHFYAGAALPALAHVRADPPKEETEEPKQELSRESNMVLFGGILAMAVYAFAFQNASAYMQHSRYH